MTTSPIATLRIRHLGSKARCSKRNDRDVGRPSLHRLKYLFLLPLICIATSAGAVTDSELGLFRDAARDGASQQVRQKAAETARSLGNAKDLAALDELIGLRDLRHLRSLASGWRPTTPEYETRVLEHFQDRDVAAILVDNLHNYRNPALFEALYRDAETLAQWRAARRRDCVVRVREYQPPWIYVCRSGLPDDRATDVDGRPHGPHGRRNRELASVEALPRNALPGTEPRLAMLFRDLSLYPLVERSVETLATVWNVPTVRPPLAFLSFFSNRQYAPPAEPLLAVLREVEPIESGPDTDRDAWWAILAFHSALVPTDSPEATRALAGSIERAARIEKPQDRRQFLLGLIPLMGPVLPGAQVDIDPLRATVLDRVPHEDRQLVSDLFARVEALNNSLRFPSAASLTLSLENKYWRRLLLYLLAHGADPNDRAAAEPPLLAAAVRNEAAALLLLDNGASVDVTGYGGVTPLHVACTRPERAQLASRLIAKGADVNATAKGLAYQAPLHAAASESPECVRLLLAAGANIEARDRLGRTPLGWAASSNKIQTARLLLDAGADPNRQDNDGGSPFSAGYGYSEMRALMESHGGRLSIGQAARRALVEKAFR